MILNDAEALTRKLLAPIVTKLNIGDYTLDINPGSAKGDGYLGDIWSVKVLHDNGALNLIVKAATTDEELRKITKTNMVFKNEINFYTIVFPEMDSFQNENGVRNPLKLTKLYASSLLEGEEMLIMEDLNANGYSLCDKREPLDKAHIILVLNHYAKLHALSLALRAQRPESFKKIAQNVANVMSALFPNYSESFIVQMKKNAQMLAQRGFSEEGTAADNLIEQLEKIIFMDDIPTDECTVVVHGDCWNNNIMFKYDVNIF